MGLRVADFRFVSCTSRIKSLSFRVQMHCRAHVLPWFFVMSLSLVVLPSRSSWDSQHFPFCSLKSMPAVRHSFRLIPRLPWLQAVSPRGATPRKKRDAIAACLQVQTVLQPGSPLRLSSFATPLPRLGESARVLAGSANQAAEAIRIWLPANRKERIAACAEAFPEP